MVDRLAAFFDAWEGWAAEVAISHRVFPILIFFRSNDSRCEWLAALGAVLDAAALLDATIEDAPPEARAAAHFVLRTGARLVQDMARQFVVVAHPEPEGVDDERFPGDRRHILEAGYALTQNAGQARERFAARRETYATDLAALGAGCISLWVSSTETMQKR